MQHFGKTILKNQEEEEEEEMKVERKSKRAARAEIRNKVNYKYMK